METNPYSNEDFSKASEYLRLAIALLSKHRIAPSPLNFRVAYDYVSRQDEKLRAVLDKAFSHSAAVSSDTVWQIYQRFYVQGDDALEKIRSELRQVIASVQAEADRSGGRMAQYADTLDAFASMLGGADMPSMVASEVQKVMQDTRTVGEAQRQFGSSMSTLVDEVESLRRELEQVKQESLTDALTALANRKAFDSAIAKMVEQARRLKAPFGLLMLDIDHFKQFNDTYGHLVGDHVLRFVGTALKRCLKGQDMAARYGGEEFAVILPDTQIDGAAAVGEQVRRAISSGELKDRSTGERYGIVTVSVGAAEFRGDETPEKLIRRADDALYRAKRGGRDRVERAS